MRSQIQIPRQSIVNSYWTKALDLVTIARWDFNKGCFEDGFASAIMYLDFGSKTSFLTRC